MKDLTKIHPTLDDFTVTYKIKKSSWLGIVYQTEESVGLNTVQQYIDDRTEFYACGALWKIGKLSYAPMREAVLDKYRSSSDITIEHNIATIILKMNAISSEKL